MPRRRSLTSDQIAAATLVVIGRDGLPALSMRTVAAELGVGTMSLYRYVESREELEQLVVERVLGDVDVAPPADVDWRAQAAVLIGRTRAAVRDHPGVVPLFLVHRHTSRAALRGGEALLGVLAGAGFDGVARALALRALIAYLVGALTAEHLGPLAGPGTRAIAELVEEFPLLADAAAHAAPIEADEEFRVGLTAVLSGLTPTGSDPWSDRL